MSKQQRAALEAALARFEWLEDQPHVRGKDDCYEDIIGELHAALAEPDHLRDATEMIDDRLRIERLVRSNARRAMVIDIIERLVENPECEMHPSGMEYWNPLHDALRAKLLAAPRREWKGLTDEEVERLTEKTFWPDEFARAIEAKLKEKNHGI